MCPLCVLSGFVQARFWVAIRAASHVEKVLIQALPGETVWHNQERGSIITYRLGYRCELPVEFLPH